MFILLGAMVWVMALGTISDTHPGSRPGSLSCGVWPLPRW
jgi:hypothetical protein